MTRAGDSSPLFAAKVSAPRLRAPSVRADQLAMVAQARDARMLLVRAPAGYGKTTLVAAAAKDLEWRHIWYRLDSLDGDPRAFLRSLTRALRRRWPSFGDALLEGAEGSDEGPSADEMAVMLARELETAVDGDLYLVLDDYETLASARAFNEVLTALLDHLPPAVHMLVLSRRRPSFPTANMALNGLLVEVTHRDLRFGREQVAAVVERQTGTPPTSASVERLLHLTEGWAAGVLLAGKAARWMDPAGMDDSLGGRDLEREVFPYLAEQVYSRQSGQTQEFLKATCCLESMTASLAETVTGLRDAKGLLENLEADEVFTFTDPSGDAYRYHPLFRRFVGTRLVHEEGEDAYHAVQRRTADGLAAHGLFASAVGLYLTLDQPQGPLALVRERGHDVLDDCSETLVSEWVDRLRNTAGAPPGWASLLEGHGLARSGHWDDARAQLREALASLDGDEVGRYLAHRELALCFYHLGDDNHAIHHLREGSALARDDHEEADYLHTLAIFLSSACRWQELGEALAALEGRGPGISARLSAGLMALESRGALARGDIRAALREGEKVIVRFRSDMPKQSTAAFLLGLAHINCCALRYGRAAQLLEEAQDLCDRYHMAKRRADLKVMSGTLLAQEGRIEECLAVFGQAPEEPLLQSDPLLQAELHSRRGTVLRRSGELDMAAQAYTQAIGTVAHRDVLEDELHGGLDLAFTRGLSGMDDDVPREMRRLMDEAAGWQLLFQVAKGGFFLGVLSLRQGDRACPELASSCGELLRLGQLDFLGQEAVAYPEVAEALLSADVDEITLGKLLGAIAPQAGGPALMARLATLSDRAGLLVLESARLHLPVRQAGRVLQALRHHPSKRVRDQARRVILPAVDAAEDQPGVRRHERLSAAERRGAQTL